MAVLAGLSGCTTTDTHLGGADGTVDLGNGQTATVDVDESDGVTFDWSATIPISMVIVRGPDPSECTAESCWSSVYPYAPGAMSGTGLIPPIDPDLGMQLPLVSVKFCFALGSSAPDGGTPPPPDAGSPTDDAGGGKSW